MMYLIKKTLVPSNPEVMARQPASSLYGAYQVQWSEKPKANVPKMGIP
jgi:hypothetical protein